MTNLLMKAGLNKNNISCLELIAGAALAITGVICFVLAGLAAYSATFTTSADLSAAASYGLAGGAISLAGGAIGLVGISMLNS